jgi:hypothetical protein
MKTETRLYLAIVFVIVLFDGLASLASRTWRFDYTRLDWVSFCLYAASGFLALKYRGLKGGVLAGLLAGFTDATLGWALSSAIGPDLPFPPLGHHVVVIVLVVVTVSMWGAFFGLVGALLRLALSRLQRRT